MKASCQRPQHSRVLRAKRLGEGKEAGRGQRSLHKKTLPRIIKERTKESQTHASWAGVSLWASILRKLCPGVIDT